MKKNRISLLVATLLLLNSCFAGICSPIFANIQVLDSDSKSIENVAFSVTLDGKPFSDTEVNYHSGSSNKNSNSENSENNSHEVDYIDVTKPYYVLTSNKWSRLLTKSNHKIDFIAYNLYSKMKITISKEGYETVTFVPLNSMTRTSYNKSIRLKRN